MIYLVPLAFLVCLAWVLVLRWRYTSGAITGRAWVLLSGAGLAVVTLGVVLAVAAYNAGKGLPLDGAEPRGEAPSLVALAVICPSAGVTVHDVGDFGDELAKHCRPRLSPIIATRADDCQGETPEGVVRIRSCESDAAVCTDPEGTHTGSPGALLAGVTHARMDEGRVVAADTYVRGPLDDLHGDGGQARTLAHELLIATGVGLDAEGRPKLATGSTHIMSHDRGPSWRWLDRCGD